MQREGASYTVLFAAGVCVVCSLVVSSAAVVLKPRQEQNALLDKQKKVLAVAGLMKPGERLSAAEAQKRFDSNIQVKLVDLRTGDYAGADAPDPATYDQVKAAKDPLMSEPMPSNAAQVQRRPYYAIVYHVIKDGNIDMIVIPVEGKGLWSTLYGFLALDKDTTTIRGLTFYQHGETPGLGGEVDNPLWKAKWPNRKAYDEDWKPAIHVIKGPAGPPEEDPYEVDGLSGATMTSRGVSHLMAFWLGENGFGPYLEKFRNEGSAA